MLKKIFFFFLYVLYEKWPFQLKNEAVHLLKQGPECKIIKIGTNSELIHED